MRSVNDTLKAHPGPALLLVLGLAVAQNGSAVTQLPRVKLPVWPPAFSSWKQCDNWKFIENKTHLFFCLLY